MALLASAIALLSAESSVSPSRPSRGCPLVDALLVEAVDPAVPGAHHVNGQQPGEGSVVRAAGVAAPTTRRCPARRRSPAGPASVGAPASSTSSCPPAPVSDGKGARTRAGECHAHPRCTCRRTPPAGRADPVPPAHPPPRSPHPPGPRRSMLPRPTPAAALKPPTCRVRSRSSGACWRSPRAGLRCGGDPAVCGQPRPGAGAARGGRAHRGRQAEPDPERVGARRCRPHRRDPREGIPNRAAPEMRVSCVSCRRA